MAKKNIKDDIEKILISGDEIEEIVGRISANVDDYYRDRDSRLLLLGILKGSVVFMGELMKKITVPVEFTGVARGTKVGGKLETYREQIQLMAKPLDMPAKVTIDISGMDVGTTIQIADVKLPEGVKAAYDNNYAIVSVLMPGGDDAAAE